MLPKNETTVHLDAKGVKTKRPYVGDFTVKCCLTNEEDREVSLRTDRYCGGSVSLPTTTVYFNRAVAELEVRIKQDDRGNQMAPSWWRDSRGGWELLDKNVVYELYGLVDAAEKQWCESLDKAADEADKATKKD